VACIVALVIGFLFAIITAWELCYKNGMTKCCEVTCNKCTKNLKYKKCLDLTLKLINAVFLIFAVWISSKTRSFFTSLSEDLCSDTATNIILTDFATQVEEFVYSKNVKGLIMFVVMMVVEIASFIYKKTCGKEEEEKGKGGKNKMRNGGKGG